MRSIQINEKEAWALIKAIGWKPAGKKLGCDPKTLRYRLDPEYRLKTRTEARDKYREEHNLRRTLVPRYDFADIDSRRRAAEMLAAIPPDTRSFTAKLMGDPPFHRSALAQKRGEART